MIIKNGLNVTKDRTAELNEIMAALVKKEVLVGIPEEKSQRTGPFNNAEIGYIQETGSPSQNIPARPHLVPGVAKAMRDIQPIFKETADKVISGEPAYNIDIALNRAGLIAVNAVKQMITNVLKPKLSDVTIYHRQHRTFPPPNMDTKPLYDTGDYFNHITYVIRDRKKKKNATP